MARIPSEGTDDRGAGRDGTLPIVTSRLSLGAVAGVAFIAAVAIPRSAIPLLDGDVWWHLRAGEAVLATGRVPGTDSWTIAGQGMRWISQDWLTNTAMAVADARRRPVGTDPSLDCLRPARWPGLLDPVACRRPPRRRAAPAGLPAPRG